MKEIILTRDNLVETGEEIAKFLWGKNYPEVILDPDNAYKQEIHHFLHLNVTGYFSRMSYKHGLELSPPGKAAVTWITLGDKIVFHEEKMNIYGSEGYHRAIIS